VANSKTTTDMFCKECGGKIDKDSKFCSYCGTKQSLNFVSQNIFVTDSNVDSVNEKIKVHQFLKKRMDTLKNEVSKTDKFDRTYKGDIYATIIGIITGFANSMILNYARQSTDNTLIAIFWIFLVVWCFIAILMVVNIAKKQNRNTFYWGVFAFFLPYLAMIIIGLLKKLNRPTSSIKPESSEELKNNDVSVKRIKTVETKMPVWLIVVLVVLGILSLISILEYL
jgi:RNA polymerase subunit RPABC4/transcription elongation factor Spt4